MKYIAPLMLTVLFVLSRSTNAESNFAMGNQALSTSARVHFVIKIPATMSVRIAENHQHQPNNANIDAPLTAKVQGNSGTMLLTESKSQYLQAANIKLLKNAETHIQHQDTTPVIYTVATP